MMPVWRNPLSFRAVAPFGVALLGLAVARPAAAQDWLHTLFAQASPAPETPTAPASVPANATVNGVTAPAPFSSGWMSSIKLNAQVEGGIVYNAMRPEDALNNGQLFTDKSGQAQLNQILLTAERDTDPKATGYDFGFKFQALYGSDARYLHYLGEFNHAIDTRYQFSIIEANVTAHLPWLTEGGIDAKLGQFSTPLGYEVIDPKANPFYSHSYIFNFGLPFVQTGLLTITHVNPVVDIYLGADTGVNTTFAGGDENGEPAGTVGFGLNISDSLTFLALSHMGPEDSCLVTPQCNSALRYLNDAVLTYKVNDKLTLVTEANYIKEAAFRAEGYGVAQYASYALTDTLTLNGRAEVWRDNAGFFVASFPGNLDYIKSELGLPNTSIPSPATTYSEITLGVTYKPSLPAPISTLMIRPEIRYDRALNGRLAFSQGRNVDAFTVAADAILGF